MSHARWVACKADDAIEVCTTGLTLDAVVDKLLKLIKTLEKRSSVRLPSVSPAFRRQKI